MSKKEGKYKMVKTIRCPICNSRKIAIGKNGLMCLVCNYRLIKENKEIRLNGN
jgi:hypothetical protein